MPKTRHNRHPQHRDNPYSQVPFVHDRHNDSANHLSSVMNDGRACRREYAVRLMKDAR
jgi:hypothetical protein